MSTTSTNKPQNTVTPLLFSRRVFAREVHNVKCTTFAIINPYHTNSNHILNHPFGKITNIKPHFTNTSITIPFAEIEIPFAEIPISFAPIPISFAPIPISFTPIPFSISPLPFANSIIPFSFAPIPISNAPLPISITKHNKK